MNFGDKIQIWKGRNVQKKLKKKKTRHTNVRKNKLRQTRLRKLEINLGSCLNFAKKN
jgi:hypothetical protein